MPSPAAPIARRGSGPAAFGRDGPVALGLRFARGPRGPRRALAARDRGAEHVALQMKLVGARNAVRRSCRGALAPAAAALVAGLSASCASYPERTQRALDDFCGGHLERSIEAFQDVETTGSTFLSAAEAGTVALAAGEWDLAIQELGKAAQMLREEEREAAVSPESAAESLAGLVWNEQAARYRAEGYERVTLHAMLAIARLAKGDLEGVRVEVRRANALLEGEEELYETEYAAGGLGHLLSAISYELDRKPDDAYIDYARMESKSVGAELAGRALVRLASRLRYADELERWRERYGDPEPMPEDAASIVVIAGVGLGPYKQEHLLMIPTPDGLLQWAVPSYAARPQAVSGLELEIGGGDRVVRTVAVEHVSEVARENLEDRIAWLATKSAVRSVLKRELTKELEEEAGLFGRLVGDVFAIATERADLRAWRTLPDSWQAARAFLAPGSHSLTLTALGGEAIALGTYELSAGETMFVIARTAGTRLRAEAIGGRRVGGAPQEVSP